MNYLRTGGTTGALVVVEVALVVAVAGSEVALVRGALVATPVVDEVAAAGADEATADAAAEVAATVGTTPPRDAVAPHAVAGTALPCWLYASGYSHPETAVTNDAVSCVSNHPSPVLTVTLAVKLCGGSVSGPRSTGSS